MSPGFARRRGEGCLSDLVLDRIVVGELDEAAQAAHLSTCGDCRARLAELRAAQAAAPQPLFLAGLAAAARRRARRRGVLAVGGLSTLLAAAAVLAVVGWPGPPEGTRTKGGLSLELVARRGAEVGPLLPGAVLAPGDAIRFRVGSDVEGWLAVVGVDARPSVTAYAPVKGRARRWSAGRDQLVDGSIVLDDTLGAERVVAVLCARELEVAEVVRAGEAALARAGGDPREVGDLGLGCRQASVLFHKAAQP